MKINWKSFALYILVAVIASSAMKAAGVNEMLRFGLMIMLIFVWPNFMKPS